MVFTGRGVDENHLHPRSLPGSLEPRQVAVVEPGRLHSLEAGRRSRVYPLTKVWQLGEEPGNVRTEPERSHVEIDKCAAQQQQLYYTPETSARLTRIILTGLF